MAPLTQDAQPCRELLHEPCLPVPGDAQGQARGDSEQTDLPIGVPVHCKGVGLDGLYMFLPIQMIL